LTGASKAGTGKEGGCLTYLLNGAKWRSSFGHRGYPGEVYETAGFSKKPEEGSSGGGRIREA